MFQQHHCDHISDDLQKMTPSRILPSSPPPWWPGWKRSRPAAPRSREKPGFIEGVVRAPLPSAFGSDHRSTAASSPATRSHREQLHLHRGPTPMGISPNSTWVKQHKSLDLVLQLVLSTPAPISDQLRPAIPAERAKERPGLLKATLNYCSLRRAWEGGNEDSHCSVAGLHTMYKSSP
jgi:hypothetical protein